MLAFTLTFQIRALRYSIATASVQSYTAGKPRSGRSAIPWTAACQAPLSMGFSRQEYWSGLPFPPPGDFPNPGTEPRSPASQADSLKSEPLGKSRSLHSHFTVTLLERSWPSAGRNTTVPGLQSREEKYPVLRAPFSPTVAWSRWLLSNKKAATILSHSLQLLWHLMLSQPASLQVNLINKCNSEGMKKGKERKKKKTVHTQSYRFSSSHIRMWQLEHKEAWALKKWCFRIVVLEKTLDILLDCKEIKLVNPKWNQPWILTGRTGAGVPILWPPEVKSQLTGKDPDGGNYWRQEEKRVTEDEMVRQHHQLNEHEFEQTPGDSGGQGSLACYSLWVHKESDTI